MSYFAIPPGHVFRRAFPRKRRTRVLTPEASAAKAVAPSYRGGTLESVP